MPLINLTTNLKSNEFGHDRAHGGNSNQPYIQSPLPGDPKFIDYDFGSLDTDFILRGGSKSVTRSAKDVLRLGKYFLDIRNPSGLLFVAKQNLLSRTAVRTQASSKLVNEGAYTPLSTLAQAGGVAFGLHVNKQGLNPFNGLLSPGDFTPDQYADIVKNEFFEITTADDDGNVVSNNRLINLFQGITLNNKGISLSNKTVINPYGGGVTILSYSGGPGSTLGIGNTNIKFADQRTGVNNINGKDIVDGNYLTSRTSQTINRVSLTTPPLGVANKWFEATQLIDAVSTPNLSTDNGYTYITINDAGNPVGEYNTYSQKQLINIPGPSEVGVEYNGQSFHIGKSGVTTPGDFRTLLREKQSSIQKSQDTPQFGSLTNAPIYTEKNIEQRVLLGSPGDRSLKNLSSYTNGTNPGAVHGYSGGNASINSYDKINALPIYLSDTPDEKKGNDLVKFRIGVIDNDNPSLKTYIHFRAFINQISDGYTSEWSDTRYIGRGEKFYTYTGFDRKVSLSWTVAAQSKAELIPMYKKLNFLASICAPDYSAAGYMRGNIVTLTIGGYFYEQPGIITGLSYEMNDDNSTWEIGINDEGGSDDKVKELPHMIKVSSFNFIPIHTFVPRKQQIGYNPQIDILTDANGYGPERYIALANGFGDEKNNYGKVYVNPVPEKKPIITDPLPKLVITDPPPSLVLGNQIQNVSGGGTIDKTGNFNRSVNLNPINNGNTGVNRSINIEKIKKSKLPLKFTGISVPV